jgi:hypothetical protein
VFSFLFLWRTALGLFELHTGNDTPEMDDKKRQCLDSPKRSFRRYNDWRQGEAGFKGVS